MPRVYVTSPIEYYQPNMLLRLFFSEHEREGGLFQEIPTAPFKTLFHITDDPSGADVHMLYHDFFSIRDTHRRHIDEAAALARRHGKRLMIFAYGDRDDPVSVENTIVFRTSQYKSAVQPHEVIMPPFVEDLGGQFGHTPKRAFSDPVVSFVGWSQFSSVWLYIKFFLKVLRYFFHGPRLRGMFFRRRVVSVLKSADFQTHIVTRTSYSGHVHTISGDSTTLRQEYVHAIQDADFSLAVKGDGNYSLRFFEILSLGRIPLLIDTDTPLPLEDVIDYNRFVLRVDYRKIRTVPERVMTFRQQTTPGQFASMQLQAREAFVQYLRADSFFKHIFSTMFLS